MTKVVSGGLASVLVIAGCGGGGAGDGSPIFRGDALWPQPLEDPHDLGSVSAVTVAADGNVLLLTRPEDSTPAVFEFAPDGGLVQEWGGPDNGYPWPERPNGIAVDPDGYVWIGGEGTHVLKLTRSGDHIMTIGRLAGDAAGDARTSFGGAADFAFDAAENEAYLADDANHRVVVLDLSTGEFKRSWEVATVSCVTLVDDRVYACDRENDRIQVFEKDGTAVTEALVGPRTLGRGSVFDIAASPDGTFLYVADGATERVHVLEREGLTFRTSFGFHGVDAGQFGGVGSLAVDAAGNVYATENGQGRTVQRFVYQGVGPVPVEPAGASL